MRGKPEKKGGIFFRQSEEAVMILDEIVADKKKRLPEHKVKISEQEMRRMAE